MNFVVVFSMAIMAMVCQGREVAAKSEALVPMPAPQPCPAECSACYDGYANCASKGLTSLPSGYWPLVSVLNLNGNNISSLTSLSGFPNLQELVIVQNSLQVLNLQQFANLPKLRSVMAYQNLITRIIPSTVLLPGGLGIYVEANFIHSVEPGDLGGLVNLKTLSIESNPLSLFPVAAVDGRFAPGGRLSIRGTPISCGGAAGGGEYGQLAQLKKWALANQVELNANC